MTIAAPQTVFFHAPRSRSSATLALFEELDVAPAIHLLDIEAGTQRHAAYLAVNPMGKVPAIRHAGVLVTEQPAVMAFLAELHADKGLAPLTGEPLRGPFLRWMAFYGACFEPAVLDHAAERDPLPATQCGYGDYDSVIGLLAEQLGGGSWLLGERFSAADVLYGGALRWTLGQRMVPELPVFRAYAERVTTRRPTSAPTPRTRSGWRDGRRERGACRQPARIKRRAHRCRRRVSAWRSFPAISGADHASAAIGVFPQSP